MGVVYIKTKIELSGLISQGGVCDENQKNNDLTDHAGVFNVKTDIKLSWLIRPGTIYDKN